MLTCPPEVLKLIIENFTIKDYASIISCCRTLSNMTPDWYDILDRHEQDSYKQDSYVKKKFNWEMPCYKEYLNTLSPLTRLYIANTIGEMGCLFVAYWDGDEGQTTEYDCGGGVFPYHSKFPMWLLSIISNCISLPDSYTPNDPYQRDVLELIGKFGECRIYEDGQVKVWWNYMLAPQPIIDLYHGRERELVSYHLGEPITATLHLVTEYQMFARNSPCIIL